MNRYVVVLVTALSATCVAETTADVPVPACGPLNPAFLEWRSNLASGVTARSSAAVSRGYVPSPFDASYLTASYAKRAKARTAEPLPTRFSLCDSNWVTSVKNQNPYGTCWAHATMASLETWLLRNEGRTFDLSENNLVNRHGFDWGFNNGGNGTMSSAYLLRWDGPVLEADDPYFSVGTSSALPPTRHVQGVKWIPARANAYDNDEIKRAVMRFGALLTMYHDESVWGGNSYYRPSGAYYYNGSGDPNHAVAIVGWDDTYAASNFATTPPGDGAFIVKNSWGTDWGDSGYFHISYYDTRMATMDVQMAFTDVETTNNYGRIYQYDPLGCIGWNGYGTSTAWAANVFTADADEELSAVGFYALEPGSQYDVYVYTNCTMRNGNPRTGTLACSTNGVLEYAGYATVPLPMTMPLGEGAKFSIVLTYTVPDGIANVPCEYAVGNYSSSAVANAGESFISVNGRNWSDLSVNGANCCIKAYTKGMGASEAADAAPVRLVSAADCWHSGLAQDGFMSFVCDTAWTMVASEEWLTIPSSSGSGGAITNRYAIAANGTGTTRTARLVVTDATGAAVTQTVHQAVATAPPTVSNRYYGLFVGVNEYSTSGFDTLDGCVNDALAMRERFTDWGFCRRDDAVLLTNSLATVAAVRNALTNIAAQATAGDTVLYFQASHGHLATGTTVALVEHDGYYWDYDLAADLATFADGVRVVVMADTCYSGGLFKRGGGSRRKFNLAERVQSIMAENRSSGRLLKARNLVAPGGIGWITAADYNQFSWDYGDYGLFTYLCLDGWATGAADVDGDGRVSFYDLWLYSKEIAAAFVAENAGETTEAQCLNEDILLAALAGVTDASTSETETYSAPVRVPHDWLDGWMENIGYGTSAGGGYSYADYNSAVLGIKTTPSGAKVAVWQDYVAGTVPTNPASVFIANISVTNGRPYITWSPDLGPSMRDYTVLGKEHLSDGEGWGPTNAASRFFKVEVRLKGEVGR